MIAHLSGKLVHKTPTKAVLDVGGVGYSLAISLPTYEQLPESGAETKLLTHLYVREDRLQLFGFSDEREREIFELLIGVSGIGPNSAQTILSGMSVGDLHESILHDRIDSLTGIKGIGRKTAERIVVELRDKVRMDALRDELDPEQETKAGYNSVEEAVLALITLGIPHAAARKAVNKVVKKDGEEKSVQEPIKQALQER